MAQIPSTTGREHNKFIESPERVGESAVGVVIEGVGDGSLTPATDETLQEISGKLSNLENYTDGLESFVDGLEGLATTLNTFTDGLEGFTDGIEGSLDSINAGINTNLDKAVTGDLVALDSTLEVNCNGCSTVGFATSGTFVGTNIFEVTTNGTSWVTVQCFARNGNSSSFTQSANVITAFANVAGCLKFRVRRLTATSGTVTVHLLAGAGPSVLEIYQLATTSLQVGVPRLETCSATAITAPTVTTTSSVILASNTARRMLHFTNLSGKDIYIAFAATCSSTLFTFVLPAGAGASAGATLTVPTPMYTGIVSAIIATGTGTLNVTECT